MAYNQDNLFLMTLPSLMGDHRWWTYKSADAIADVNTAGYISNAKDMGMKVMDLVLVVDTATPTAQWCVVRTVNATTGAGDLSDGTTIAVTNSD
jgi:hypothetical protein